MASKSSALAEQVRDRLGERVLAGTPQWLEPVQPAARQNALALLAGTLCGRLPAEDASALVRALVAEQRPDGAWPRVPGGAGDLSRTLEVVEALATAGDAGARTALARAVGWLETHRHGARLDDETLILLSAVTDMVPGRLRRWTMPLSRLLLLRRARRNGRAHESEVVPLALALLSRERGQALGRGARLLERQLLDGSWEGSVRSTALALLALRHASLPLEDGAFERGWRYLRSLQLWEDNRLVQNPCDLSNLLHSAAVRALTVTGVEAEIAAGGTLSLLHQARTSGGWALGGMQPTDLLTTALALDALSFAGDIPVETAWVRRRAVLLLLRTQLADGGWPLYPDLARGEFARLLHRHGRRGNRGSVDVTAAAVQALAYSGVHETGEEQALARGVRYLMRAQRPDGMWDASAVESTLFTTSRALEALIGAADDRAGKAVLNAVTVLLARQQPDGGWSEGGEGHSTPHHTAWVLRALCSAPGFPPEALRRGRQFLENCLDETALLWHAPAATWPLPLCAERVQLDDLTTLWALEALVPAGVAARSRVTGAARPRTILGGRR